MNIINTDKAPAAIGPYSQAIKVNNVVYTSGQIGINHVSGLIEGTTIVEQTEAVISNLKAVLEEAGTSLDNVVKTSCFIKNMDDFAAFNEVYAKYFTSKPARSCVEVSCLPKGAYIEIEAIAVIL